MGSGPGQDREFQCRRRRRRRRRRVAPPSKSPKMGTNAKTVFDDETYLEKRLGIVKHVPV